MSEYRPIFEYSRPEFLANLNVSREEDQGLLTLSLHVAGNEGPKSIELTGFEGLAEATSAFLMADRVHISREQGSNKEFGTIQIECWNDTEQSIFICDSASG